MPAPKQGLLVEWFVEHGAVIENGDSLARIVCEGDEVAVPAAVPMRLGIDADEADYCLSGCARMGAW